MTSEYCEDLEDIEQMRKLLEMYEKIKDNEKFRAFFEEEDRIKIEKQQI
ncbi:hypothetical protein bmyco0003_19760 [Bacillus pseudomycoides]|nr:hypothetical protein [Bacillus pseudomycoides]EEM05556.1 hypothetical protein bmyco0002_19760 [Bacillus pseudomycoides]EEM11281.1 hypothetical protein bmyco0003_19760 [Bacillus pseudomycoides]